MMKTKRDIYCEYVFWEAFFEMEEKVLRDRSKRTIWDAFYEFLSKNNLFFDIPRQTINEDSCGGANLMRIHQEKGGAGVKFIPNKFPRFEEFSNDDNKRLNAVFLTTSEDSVCENLSKRFGVIVFNLSMIFSAKHVFVNNGISFDRANRQNWTYLWELRDKYPSLSCCNSLLVADRYLLSDANQSAFENNLKPIFEALLPQQLDNDIVFNIYIIAENICRSIEGKFYEIELLIRELRPRLKFSLNIFNSKKLHDRSILTNNIILTSGAGFDIIGHNEMPLRFTTTSLCFPFLQYDSTGNNNYLDWINNIIKAKKSCRSYRQDYWGELNPRHHLLDYYYEEPVMPKATYSIGSTFADVLLRAKITE